MRQRRGLGCGCLGCGGGSLVVLALLGALAWFVVIKPARDFIAGWQPPQTQSQTPQSQTPQTQTPGAQTPNQTTPPPTGTTQAALTRSDVEKFVKVRRDVRRALGANFTQLQQVWTDVQGGQTPNILQVLGVLRQVGGSVGAARSAQSAALTREGLSLERYAAVRAGVNRALGVPNVDFARAAESLQRGQLPDLNSSVQAATAQEKSLIAPFRTELTATAAAGLLGL